jgi:TctA family transporter
VIVTLELLRRLYCYRGHIIIIIVLVVVKVIFEGTMKGKSWSRGRLIALLFFLHRCWMGWEIRSEKIRSVSHLDLFTAGERSGTQRAVGYVGQYGWEPPAAIRS